MGGHEYDLPNPPKLLQIKKEDKFFSKLLSKESSKGGEASFRVLYYGDAAGAIPFMWESQPGTPKQTFSDTCLLPPLTPPPSYQMSPTINSMKKNHQSKRVKFLGSVFSSKKKKGSGKSESFSSESFSSWSNYSVPSTPITNSFTGRSRSAVHFGLDEDMDGGDEQSSSSPTSTLCFGGGGSRRSSAGKFRSYYGIKNVKKALLSIVGHGSST